MHKCNLLLLFFVFKRFSFAMYLFDYSRFFNSLADSLDIDMPDLPEDEGTTKIGGSIIRDGSSTNEKEVGYFLINEKVNKTDF